MAALSTIAAIGLGVSVVGAGVQYYNQQRMLSQQREAAEQAENAREGQMRLDAQRRQRAAIRQSILARATALSVGTNQGAAAGSGLAGGLAQITGTGLQNQQAINSGLTLGSEIFDANRSYSNATQSGQAGMGFGSLLGSVGSGIVNNAPTINRLGTFAFNGFGTGSGNAYGVNTEWQQAYG